MKSPAHPAPAESSHIQLVDGATFLYQGHHLRKIISASLSLKSSVKIVCIYDMVCIIL